LIVFILIFFFSRTHIAENPQRNFYEIKGQAQGTTYSIRYLYSDSVVSKAEVDSIFKAIDLSLSLYKKESLINLFNRNGSVRMDEHMKNVVERSLAINKSSHGGFDITVKTLVDLWGFGVSGKKAIPSTKQIKKALSVTGSNLIFIKNDSLLARKKNVQIDCNGIAQGYSVDLMFHYLEKKGIEDILVEIGGEVRVKGKNAEGGNWKVGLESPSGITEEWYPVNEVLELDSKAVTTSGDYRNFFRDKGKMYSHIIDPRTGKPVNNGVISVTVIANDAMEADGWDNGFFVMGIEKAFATLQDHPELELRMIYLDKQGNIRDSSSVGFKKLLKK